MSISSLVNYERDRRPEPKQLVAFLWAARSAGRDDLADLFQDAILESLGMSAEQAWQALKEWAYSGNARLPENWFETEAREALELCLEGGSDYNDVASAVMAALVPVIRKRAGLMGLPERAERFAAEVARRGYLTPSGQRKPKGRKKS